MTRTNRFTLLAAIVIVGAAFVPTALRAQEHAVERAEQAIQHARKTVDAAQQTAQDAAKESIQRAKALVRDVEPIRPPSRYYLGLQCEPIDVVLRLHLRLGEDEGLLVRFVMPDSPAAAAGVQPNDILLQFGGTKVVQIDQLLDAVEANKDAETTVTLLRAGEPKTLKITPAERTEKIGRGMVRRNREMFDLSKMLEGLEDAEKNPLRLRFFHPGIVLDGPKQAGVPMPADLQIAIVKNGNEPAKITVKKGDKTWEVTEDSLDELPEDIAAHVKRMLGRSLPAGINARAFRWFNLSPAKPPVEGEGEIEIEPGIPMFPHVEGINKNLQRQLKQMQQQIEQMQEQVEEMNAEEGK